MPVPRRRGDQLDMSGGNGVAGSISMPTASRSRRSPTAATAIRSSCAIEPTTPAGQIGAPNVLLRIGRPAKPIELISSRATRRAACCWHGASRSQGRITTPSPRGATRAHRLARSHDSRSADQARRGRRLRAEARDRPYRRTSQFQNRDHFPIAVLLTSTKPNWRRRSRDRVLRHVADGYPVHPRGTALISFSAALSAARPYPLP